MIENGLMRLLYNYLDKYKQVTRNDLRRLALDNEFDISTCDRKLRKLTQGGYIRPIIGTKRFNKAYKINNKG